MAKTCSFCGNIFDDILLCCPKCKNMPINCKEKGQSKLDVEELTKQVKREILKSFIYWLGIISLIFGIGIWQAYNGSIRLLQTALEQRINEEFKQPRINETIQSVAATRAKEIISTEIKPEVEKFEIEIERRTADLKISLETAQLKLSNIENSLEKLDKSTQDKIEDLSNRPNFHQELFSMKTGISANIFVNFHKAIDLYDSKDYKSCLEEMKSVIREYENGKPYNLKSFLKEEHNKQVSAFYEYAAKSSQRLSDHVLAYEYALKSKEALKTHHTMYMASTTAYNINKYSESKQFIIEALSLDPPEDVIQRYREIEKKCEEHLEK
jgi:hypothetical protein